jgi:O-acetyl-ADP-ribose deacetylase (regulator of RNase III)
MIEPFNPRPGHVMALEIRVGARGQQSTDFETEHDLALADVLEEVEDQLGAAASVVVGAWDPLADAALGELAAALAGLTGSVTLIVGSDRVARTLRARLPGSGGRASFALAGGRELVVIEGDITNMDVAGIVNATNGGLHLGAGVSGAIRRKARPTLQHELHRMAGAEGIQQGAVVLTGAHGLPHVRAILHANAVSGDPEVVEAATVGSLELAARQGLESLAIPLLGTGTGGLDVATAARRMLAGLLRWAAERDGRPELVALVAWGDPAWKAVREAAAEVLS